MKRKSIYIIMVHFDTTLVKEMGGWWWSFQPLFFVQFFLSKQTKRHTLLEKLDLFLIIKKSDQRDLC